MLIRYIILRKEKIINGEIIQAEGLTEESLAYFLISSERTRIIKIKYIKKSGPGHSHTSVLYILFSKTPNKNVHTTFIIPYQVAVRQLYFLLIHNQAVSQPHHQLHYVLARVPI